MKEGRGAERSAAGGRGLREGAGHAASSGPAGGAAGGRCARGCGERGRAAVASQRVSGEGRPVPGASAPPRPLTASPRMGPNTCPASRSFAARPHPYPQRCSLFNRAHGDPSLLPAPARRPQAGRSRGLPLLSGRAYLPPRETVYRETGASDSVSTV